MVISTPISIVSRLAKPAINDILIKGGEFIEIPATLKAIALMTDDISKLAWLIKHSKKTLMIIKQNIKLCLTIKAIFISLAMLDLATLWMVIAADMDTTLIVIIYSQRLLR